MSEIKRVKIQNIIESQIPEFLNSDSPLFKEFLERYYISQEHSTGIVDLGVNVNSLKDISTYDNETFFSAIYPSILTEKVLAFDDVINVSHTIGFPSKYGLIKIDDEIIFYTSKTQNSFIGCFRGFSGIHDIKKTLKSDTINFVKTKALPHISTFNVSKIIKTDGRWNVTLIDPISVSLNEIIHFEDAEYSSQNPDPLNPRGIPARVTNIFSQQLIEVETPENISDKIKVIKSIAVENLNLIFYKELFKKFKSQFLPGFENRNFVSQVKIKNILSRAVDFYTTKGTDTSFKLLFNALFGKEISLIKPQEYLLRPSDNNYFITKNILVEPIKDYGIDFSQLRGKTIFQDINGLQASASIYSLEYRPFNDKNLYEIYLDKTSFINNFTSTKKTNISKKVPIDSDFIFVDSTIGFPSSGKLLVKTKNATDPVVITYTDKTDNQFLGISGVIFELDFGDEIYEERFVYTYLENDERLEFRLINVIGNVDYEESSNLRVNDKIKLSSFGTNLNSDPEFNTWVYNLPTIHDIEKISLSGDTTGTIWNVTLFDAVKFYIGETLEFANSNDENNINTIATVVSVLSNKTIQVSSQFNLFAKNKLYKVIKTGKVSGVDSLDTSKIPIGIQNTYIDKFNEYFYVTSSGLPNYELNVVSQTIECNAGPGSGHTDTLNTNVIHKFYTGEKIYFTPSSESSLFEGVYHIVSVGTIQDSNKIKLCLSKSDIYSKTYVVFDKGSTSGSFVKLDYENKKIEHQKIVKKFNYKKEQKILTEVVNKTTNNKKIGMFVNGSEIFSPTLFDENIYYGKLESISVTNSGSGYDIINPPELEIFDVLGSGAEGYLNIVGSLDRVRIINPGIGYQIKPKITILGGNGTGAVVEPNLVKSKINSGFKGDGFGVNPTENTITFFNKHNFEDGEEVIYNSNSNSEIFPLKNNSIYYVGLISDEVIKLYETSVDSSFKTNEINLVGISSGFHYLRTTKSKNTITEIYVKDGGSGYSNRLIKIPSNLAYDDINNGVNTFDHYIFAKNHNFKNKDIIRYSTTGTEISGLSTTSEYIITVIDKNKFYLSSVGDGDQINESDYNNKRYIKFGSLGSGEHTFYYPPIRLVIESLSGVGSTTVIQPEFDPIVTGKIESVFLKSNGVGYGVSDIINFHRRPDIRIKPVTSEALLKPIIINGSIVDIQFLSYGSGYDSGIDIEVYGDGKFADIRPVVDQNGKIISVNIANGGIGYLQSNTTLKIVRRGLGAKFIGNVFEWKINQIEKNKELLNAQGEGLLVPSNNKDFGLQYINFYAPKKLRYSLSDHINSSNVEVSNNVHSPIIGWAYDGNPIYGPYGLVGSEIKKIRSSYSKKVESNTALRPDFYDGFFIQDYYFDKALGDLDEHNGRFCKTPEYPNGTYAYFASINDSSISKAEYPYVVGNQFKDYPIEENFTPSFNQNLDTSKFDTIRNIGPYYINSNKSYYNLIQSNEDKYKQEFIISETLSSSVDEILVYSPGKDYKVGDNVIFDNSTTGGSGIDAAVSRIRGKNLSDILVGVTTFYDVKFFTKQNTLVGLTNFPHSFLNGDQVVISNISDSKYSFLEGVKNIIVPSKSVGLSTDIDIPQITGNTTNIYVSDYSGFEVNDYIEIGTEKLQIIKINKEDSSFTVNRLENIGFHSAGVSVVNLLPTKFYFSDSLLLTYIKENLSIYFDPKTLIGFGTESSEYTLYNQSIISVPERSIYIPNHNFYTGQQVRYNVGLAGSSLYVSDSPDSGLSFPLQDNQIIYIVNKGKDFIGISTLGFGSLSGIGTNNNSLYIYENNSTVGSSHSLTTVYSEIFGTVENYSIIAETEEDHELTLSDNVYFNVLPKSVDNFYLGYDSIIRKLITNPVQFDASTEVDIENSTIYIPNNTFSTGDKIVYYDLGNLSIGGLTNNQTYYVIKEDPNYIKLAEYRSDAVVGVSISFTSQGTSFNSISLINPLLKSTKGNIIVFDLSDPSLTGMDLKLYKDSNLSIEVESYNYKRNGVDSGSPGAELKIDTNNEVFTNVLFYKLIPLSPSTIEKYQVSIDKDVIGNNKISIEYSTITDLYKPVIVSNNKFKLNLRNKPESLFYTASSGISSIFYDTDSKSATGPISKIRLNFGGKKYKKLPKILGIRSKNGKNGTLKCVSKHIGSINGIERVKDGFDYPTDITLRPILSVPTVCQIRGISRVKSINIINGGKNYITAPKLKVIGNNNIELQSVIQGNSVVNVKITKNTKDLNEPLTVLPIKNSNGYDIDYITYNNSTKEVTLELINSDDQQFPLITNSYGNSSIDYPFDVGDQIFIENCRITDSTKSNYNSSNYGYKFFTVTGISTQNYTVTYDASSISGDFGEYTPDFGYGYVVNKKNMASFEMIIEDDLAYFSSENVVGYDLTNSPTFTAKVIENGWDNDINQLRLIDSVGDLRVGYKLHGKTSGLIGIVESVNKFELTSNLDVSREKLNDFGDRVGFLNDYQQRISDNEYYQKFSYSIKSDINYEDWKESVRTLVHPAGFKEFSDLNVVEKASNNMKVGVGDSSLSILVNIDEYATMYAKPNFAMVLEEDQFEDGSIERIVFQEGIDLKSYILSKTNKVLKIDDISDQFTGLTTTLGGTIIGPTSFKLKNKGTSLFYHEFFGDDASVIDLDNDSFNIKNHNFQSGQRIFYDVDQVGGTRIGIQTTSYVESSIIVTKGLDTPNPYISVASTESNILMEVLGGEGTSIYENGYNVAISTSINGTSASVIPDFSLNQNAFYGFTDPFPSYYTSGIGTGATFNVFIVYDSGTGNPISTSVILRSGGNGYAVGDTVSISGTFMNGISPQNDLSFTVSNVSNTRIVSAANSIFLNIPSTTLIGLGTGATFNVSRDSFGDITIIDVSNGGSGYALTDNISIAGTYIGGSTPQDNLLISPKILGRNDLPNTLYVIKLNDNSFKVSGLSTSLELNLISNGLGTNSFTFDNPNASSIISIDNIIQSPLYNTDLILNLSSTIGILTDILFVSSGLSSITSYDVLKINSELMTVKNIGFGYTNAIQVNRGAFGSGIDTHFNSSTINVLRGNYNIVKDTIYFATPPYGSIGPVGLTVNSSFAGRAFTRQFDPNLENDKNLIFDDISKDFVSVSSTEFYLKSNGESVVGIYTDTNSIIVGNVDINSNPIILINGIPQISETDFTIDSPGNNRLKFLSGSPISGKISRTGLSTGYGYQPLVSAGASVTVSNDGTISGITLLGSGSGYKNPPKITLQSIVGSGASFSAVIGAGGTVTNISIVNAGSGYTFNPAPVVLVDVPVGYSDLPLEYISGTSGNGYGAKASVIVGNQSNIIGFELEDSGQFYKVGDVLKVSGITTNPLVGVGFSEFRITVEETLSDKFSGFYPGQFVQFDDLSPFFNGIKKKFTLYTTQGSNVEILSFKVDPSTDLKLENNLFVYLNDILQEPEESYSFNGSRLVFKEAPKKNTKCAVLFYRGSDLDVERVDPPKTIKPGDTVQIVENILDPVDRTQFDRVVKRIISPESLDTFTYDSIGINTDETKQRPLTWKKQTTDLILNGVLYSKSRPDLTSRIVPTTKLIKNVNLEDTKLYVNNAFPIFTAVDNVAEELRDIKIIDNKELSPAIATAIVSSASTISSILITDAGIGYENNSPFVAISSSFIKKKDPIYNWELVQSGISSDYSLNSMTYTDTIVSVGSSGIVGISSDGLNWISSKIGIGETTDFNSIFGYEGSYYAVGDNGIVVYLDSSSGFSTSSWQSVQLLKEETVLGSPEPIISSSSYASSFNEILYSPDKNIVVCVGNTKGLFSAVGIGTTTLFERVPPILVNLNSITINDRITPFISGLLFVAVGDSGNIIYSSDGSIWAKSLKIPTTKNLNKIIWDSFRFITVGNSGTVLTSVNGLTGWEKVNTNITDDLINIKYEYGIYIALNSFGELFFSYNLSHWVKRVTNQQNQIKDFTFIPPSKYIIEGRSVIVGSNATISYADPIYNRAVAISSVSSGSVSSISIVEPGFGYDQISPPPVIIESSTVESEKILSIKAVGDFGIINNISVGASTLHFELQSEMYDNSSLGIGYSSLNTYGVNYSQLSVGDYFVIYESNSPIGHALTGITTSLGGLSNYPASKVGTAVSYLDGVYRVEEVSAPSVGIVTVRCNFAYGPNNIPIQVNKNTNTNGVYGRYTWGKIYDYQNRTRLSPKNFYVDTDNGLIGLSTAPDVVRTRGIF